MHIKATLQRLWQCNAENLVKEIIVADGGSTDATVALAQSEGVTAVVSLQKGRAAQMNYGAAMATQPVLYFLHADTTVSHGFTTDIRQAVDKGFQVGCYRLAFDHNHWFLRANCWFTRFDVNAFRFGDQSLSVVKEKFEQAGGFCERHLVLEDQHLIKKLRKVARFTIIQKPVVTSARKYLGNGIFKTQGIFFLIYFMYCLGYTQQKLVSTYRKLIRQDKL